MQPHLCFRNEHLRHNAGPRVVKCCSKKGPTSRQRQKGCERATGDYNEVLRQQAAAIAATFLLSAGHACTPAEAYNVRLQDVENKEMQAGMQATKVASPYCPSFSSDVVF